MFYAEFQSTNKRYTTENGYVAVYDDIPMLVVSDSGFHWRGKVYRHKGRKWIITDMNCAGKLSLTRITMFGRVKYDTVIPA